MTHQDYAPNTFALVFPLLEKVSKALHHEDQQIAMIAATHAALSMVSTFIAERQRETPALRQGLLVLDEMLAGFYDGYERSLAAQTRQ